ncbi:BREX-2 system adenine-specific DNA-methyltransferase PglX [Frigoribacterium sp. SL97]|uniref:BREX-2 system adenine-specific DNA-methyltransferase PglX n=1 Tax=Frigoribacterium sp. SL97 TaxID=2994664 RepID=UPI002271324D|nr:BREX-2 system adenine-specific DNA-methyltransferase PglX [Frigoribacterium sp. SL97]WAC52168.1 BREX-2 system adenine-specific DNA-methyltransferase PglX [Frigoribacterium sp. SL97]
MIDSAALLSDLKQVLKALEADLKVRAEDSSTDWGGRLHDEYDRAKAKERTGLAWIEWRDGEVSQAAVAWIIATVFIRFAEDNGLLAGAELDGRRVALPWIAAPGEGLERAVENETAFYAASPTMTSRDWLHQAFRTLASLPAGRPLVDPDHSPVWHARISATASDDLLRFFRHTTPAGELVHDFSDAEFDTRFLGDLYQDLSQYAKKTYALLQTPVFVEEFILDLTLTPAIAEFGLAGLKLIDPTCGSGHFLLGAFDRLVKGWAAAAPNVDLGERVQRALDSIHGVDLNPFAAAIARFRLTVAAIEAAGTKTLVAAPAFHYHVAIGDSLLGGQSVQLGFDLGDEKEFEYSVEDLQQHADILRPGQYHVVVGNPPYITIKDRALNQRYREMYSTCAGTYALSVPFMELFFRLALKPDGGAAAGYVGQITSNSFMKREFGKKLIEQFLSGVDLGTRVDLTHIIDTSGAYIPGHGTPTVVLIGRRRKPVTTNIRAVLSVRGEPTQPADPARGVVWREIVDHVGDITFDGPHVTISDIERALFAAHPWSLSGGGAGDLQQHIESGPGVRSLIVATGAQIGGAVRAGADDAFMRPRPLARERNIYPYYRHFVVGDGVRDWGDHGTEQIVFPYSEQLLPTSLVDQVLWPWRSLLAARATFQGTMADAGLRWTEYMQFTHWAADSRPAITFAEVATHNHFVLNRGGEVFKQTAPIIKLPNDASEDDYLGLLGVLNSSTALFWLRQVAHNKGNSTDSKGARVTGDPSFDTYQFNSTKVGAYPLPQTLPSGLARRVDLLARLLLDEGPAAVVSEGRSALIAAQHRWNDARRTMVALQEELDWQVYAAYGLVDRALAPSEPEIVMIEPSERPFEVRLARALAEGSEQSAWFDRHGRTPVTEAPNSGSQAWNDLWRARYDAAESGFINMLERPEYKRRWAGATWKQLVAKAAVEALLDRLEAPELWRDGRGVPLVRSVAQVADDLRRDDAFRELLSIRLGTQDYDLHAEVGKLLAGDAVPGLAVLRYKESGIEKFRAWERTWELQRAEDSGERVDVPVPPKYAQGDFLKTSYWSARGKLDVPRERFIAFPGSRLPEDTTELYGWAGWDHGERGQAVARLANDLSRAGSHDEQTIPLVGVLLELEPWLKQWHHDIDARSGVSPATAVSGITTSLLGRLGLGRDQVVAWRPPAPTRRRKSAS